MQDEDDSLREIAHDLAEAPQLDEVLERIPELALRAVPALGATLERVDAAADQVVVIGGAGTGVPPLGTTVPYPGSMAADVLERNAPEVLTADELRLRPIADTLPEICKHCSALVVPLISEKEAVGALILLRPQDAMPFTADEAARLRVLGDMAALALRRVLLQERIDRVMGDLADSERRFRLLVHSVKDYAIFMLDTDGVVISWNDGAERIKGYTADDILQRHFSVFYPEEVRRSGHPDEALRVAAREGVYREEGWRVRADGSRFRAHVTITAVHDERQQLIGFAKVTRDLTERVESELERGNLLDLERAARLEAERANRAKSEFLATMSHELRTPLNAILGYTDLLESGVAGPLTDAQRSYISRLRSSSRHLTAMVGDVLDMARIESGRVDVQLSALYSSDAVDAAADQVRPQCEAKDVLLTNGCVNGDVVIRADAHRLQQVLINLLGNAVKFTEPGGTITITCGDAAEPAHGAQLDAAQAWSVIRIQDTGVGIPADRLESIWEPFEQAESGLTRSREGAGLGLAISRSLARLMGGDLVAYSESGTGSTFLLYLERASADDVIEPEGERDRRGPERETKGVSIVGNAALAEIQRILYGYLARLRTDPEVPSATAMSDADLEDHAATLLADISAALHAVEEAAGGPSPMLRDSQAIQRTLAERHGERRIEAGWSPAELRRDYQILREELERAVRRRSVGMPADGDGAAAVEHGLALFSRFIHRAEQISLGESVPGEESYS
jgi:PAS domain S-box-containing protein